MINVGASNQSFDNWFSSTFKQQAGAQRQRRTLNRRPHSLHISSPRLEKSRPSDFSPNLKNAPDHHLFATADSIFGTAKDIGPKPVARRWEIIFTVPEDAKSGDRICCDLPTGSVATAIVPPDHPPGDKFTVVYPRAPGQRESVAAVAADKRFKCKICGRRFRNEMHLRIHGSSHNRAVPARTDRQQLIPHPSRIRIAVVARDQDSPKRSASKYTCASCARVFRSQAALEVHTARHHTMANRDSTDPLADVSKYSTSRSFVYSDDDDDDDDDDEGPLSPSSFTRRKPTMSDGRPSYLRQRQKEQHHHVRRGEPRVARDHHTALPELQPKEQASRRVHRRWDSSFATG